MSLSLTVGAGAGVFSALHCAAMCGPLAAAQAQRGGRHPVLRYQLGRAAAYAGLGGVAGGTGHALTSVGGPAVGAAVSLSAAAGLLLLAARLWRRGDAPRAGEPAPIPLGRRRRPLVARLVSALRPGPLGMGALSSLLPCGALWAALALAAGTGGAMSGALAMLGFAATSAVGLAATGWLGRLLRRRSLAGRRALASVLVAGAVLAALRPIGAMAAGPGELPPCHRDAGHAAGAGVGR
jgi:sulfite exporter TauE/SafE